MHIAVIGGGYVGLVSAVCFAEIGNTVFCIEKDRNSVSKLKSGSCTIYEPELEDLLKKNLAESRLFFDSKLGTIFANKVDVILIAVGTPLNPVDGRANLIDLENVVVDISQHLSSRPVTLIIKSTVPVGTSRNLTNIIRKKNPAANFTLVSNPEFLREGSAVHDFFEADRIIVGSEDVEARKTIMALYEPWIARRIPIVFTTLETAELIKYTANCFLATRIALINEIANLCERTGADIEQVAYGIGLDKRIGTHYLQAGPGFGGSCFPKDTIALVRTAEDYDTPLTIIEAVITSNENRKNLMVDKIVAACLETNLGGTYTNTAIRSSDTTNSVTGNIDANLTGKTIAILGIAFKANTNDIRDSAAIPIIQKLIKMGAHLKIYDPAAFGVINMPNLFWERDVYAALDSSDLAVIVTEWDEFRTLDLARVKTLLKSSGRKPTIVDLRNIFEPEEMSNAGFNYISIGRNNLETITKTESTILSENIEPRHKIKSQQSVLSEKELVLHNDES